MPVHEATCFMTQHVLNRRSTKLGNFQGLQKDHSLPPRPPPAARHCKVKTVWTVMHVSTQSFVHCEENSSTLCILSVNDKRPFKKSLAFISTSKRQKWQGSEWVRDAASWSLNTTTVNIMRSFIRVRFVYFSFIKQIFLALQLFAASQDKKIESQHNCESVCVCVCHCLSPSVGWLIHHMMNSNISLIIHPERYRRPSSVSRTITAASLLATVWQDVAAKSEKHSAKKTWSQLKQLNYS